MADQVLFTEKVRNPLHDIEDGSTEGKWISLRRVIGNHDGVTSIQVLGEDGDPRNVGAADVPIYLQNGEFVEGRPSVTPSITYNTTTPSILTYGQTFDSVDNVTVDEYGRVTELNLSRYKVPPAQIIICSGEDEPVNDNDEALIWIKVAPQEQTVSAGEMTIPGEEGISGVVVPADENPTP